MESIKLATFENALFLGENKDFFRQYSFLLVFFLNRKCFSGKENFHRKAKLAKGSKRLRKQFGKKIKNNTQKLAEIINLNNYYMRQLS